MSLGVSKACFPDTSKCHNCERKLTASVKKEKDPKGNSKRCGNCHVMTYCDADCQKEHWIRVHKNHCKFLSGKTPVKDATHDVATCSQCIQERETSQSQILDENSPKTTCNIEGVAKSMKKELGNRFGFHGQGKKCSSTLEHGLQLPFALGEVSGQYLETAGAGLDPMLAHAFKIVNAMIVKANDHLRRTALVELLRSIIRARARLWYEVLVRGMPLAWNLSALSDQVDSLRSIYGATDPWWKSLKFSVKFIFTTSNFISSNFHDFNSLDDPRFQKLKLIKDYRQSQLQKQAVVSEMKMWPKFMLWPQLVNGQLAILLPPGTLCQTCNDQLTGEAEVSPHEVNCNALPFLFPCVGDNGALAACCPYVQKTSCEVDYCNTNVDIKMWADKEQRKEYEEEEKLFYIEARDCDFCLKSSLSSHRCSDCLCVQYCSKICWKKDKDFHKTVCGTWAKDESRKLLDGRKQKKHWKKVQAEK